MTAADQPHGLLSGPVCTVPNTALPQRLIRALADIAQTTSSNPSSSSIAPGAVAVTATPERLSRPSHARPIAGSFAPTPARVGGSRSRSPPLTASAENVGLDDGMQFVCVRVFLCLRARAFQIRLLKLFFSSSVTADAGAAPPGGGSPASLLDAAPTATPALSTEQHDRVLAALRTEFGARLAGKHLDTDTVQTFPLRSFVCFSIA
jgi:hypothetical protein